MDTAPPRPPDARPPDARPPIDPPPSVGATGLCFMAGALFAHGIGRQLLFGETPPQGALLLPPVLVAFSLGLLWAIGRTRARLGVALTPRSLRRQRLLLAGAGLLGLVLGGVVAQLQG